MRSLHRPRCRSARRAPRAEVCALGKDLRKHRVKRFDDADLRQRRGAQRRVRLARVQEPAHRVTALLTLMFICCIAGLGVIVLSRTIG